MRRFRGVPMGQKIAAVTKILFLFTKSNISKNQTCNTSAQKLTLKVPQYLITLSLERFQNFSTRCQKNLTWLKIRLL